MEAVITPHERLMISGIREEAPKVRTFFLEPTGEPISYKAGQFLTFLFHTLGKEERRSYSISSSPALGEPLAITVKRVENGRHSRWLIDKAATGDFLRCTGAAGLFTLPDDMTRCRQVFLFAAGIGITPLFSILKTVLVEYPSILVTLIYSNRSIAEAVFYNELISLQQQYHSRLQIEWLFSEAKDLSRARISKWLMPTLLQEYIKAPPEELFCFTCGPFDYMWLVTLLLEEAGIPSAHIRREIFVNDKKVLKIAPPDKEAHQVYIKMKGKKYEFTASYPETILQAARKQSIILPYSCEVGQCGSCTAICTKGYVWLSYNEVLTEKDLAEGKVLTCVGHPVGGDVVIEL